MSIRVHVFELIKPPLGSTAKHPASRPKPDLIIEASKVDGKKVLRKMLEEDGWKIRAMNWTPPLHAPEIVVYVMKK